MTQRYLLRWEASFNRMPEWIQELGDATIRSIAKQHCSSELSDPLDEDSFAVSLFAEGALTKSYSSLTPFIAQSISSEYHCP